MASLKHSADQHVEEADQAKYSFDDGVSIPESLVELSKDEIKRLGAKTTRTMDIKIMPALVSMYILNYLDRQNVAASKLANIMGDLSMDVQQYNTAVSILFAGYSKWIPKSSLLKPLTDAQQS